jgi:c(7)-type cytochrome triheme protein
LFLIGVLILSGEFADVRYAHAEYGDIVMNKYSNAAGMSPVVFPHWFHRARFSCKVCHADIGFKLEAGGDDVKMVKIVDGQYCGACHNGTIAWSVENCVLCHSGKQGGSVKTHGSPIALQPLPAVPAPAGPSTRIAGSDTEPFNRLLNPAAKQNLPPAEDGNHDPAGGAIRMLETPLQAFRKLPKYNTGNQVDWVKALNEGKIHLRYDRSDPNVKPVVMDLNIVREVKTSMPNVVFPHKQHTQWLDCSSCHPGIFIPQKGGNRMSMAAILEGKSCGVCHGKVAFPTSQCFRCHSQNKTGKTGLSASADARS